MSQENLSGLAQILIEQEVRRFLDLEDLVAKFAATKARRQGF